MKLTKLMSIKFPLVAFAMASCSMAIKIDVGKNITEGNLMSKLVIQ